MGSQYGVTLEKALEILNRLDSFFEDGSVGYFSAACTQDGERYFVVAEGGLLMGESVVITSLDSVEDLVRDRLARTPTTV